MQIFSKSAGFLLILFTGLVFSNILYEYRPDSLLTTQDFPSKRKFIRTCPALDSAWAMTFDVGQGSFSAQKKLPLIPVSCFRFDFVFDRLAALDTGAILPDSFSYISLLSVLADSRQDSIQPKAIFVNIRIARSNGEWVLSYQIRRPGNLDGLYKRAAVLDPGTPYCFGIRVELGQDSVAQKVEFTINGITSLEADITEYAFKLRNYVVEFGGSRGADKLSGLFYINNIAFGDSWLGNPPRKPVIANSPYLSRFTADSVRLYSPPYRSFIIPSQHSATQYQVTSADRDFSSPLFDSGPDTLGRDSLTIPVKLDSQAIYLWRARHHSADGNKSEWSVPGALSFSHDPRPILIHVSLAAKQNAARFGWERILFSIGVSITLGISVWLWVRKRKKQPDKPNL